MRPIIVLLLLLSQHIVGTTKDAKNASASEPDTTSPRTETELVPNTETPRDEKTNTTATGLFAKENTRTETSSQVANDHLSTTPTASSEVPPSELDAFVSFSSSTGTPIHSETTLTLEDFGEEVNNVSSSYDSTGQNVGEKSTGATFITSTSLSSSGALLTSSPSYQQTSGFWNNSFDENVGFSSPVTTTVPSNEETSLNASKFEDFFNLPTENITQCLETDSRLVIHALSGQISFSRKPIAMTKIKTCRINVIVPVGMVLDLDIFLNVTNCNSLEVNLFKDDDVWFYRRYRCSTAIAYTQTPGNNVTLRIRTYPNHAVYGDLFLNFTTSLPPRLEKEYTSPTTGYVQSPWWDGKRRYPPFFNGWTQINATADSSIMVSFFRLNIEGNSYTECYDRLIIIIGDKEMLNGTSQSLSFCDTLPFPKPAVFHSNLLSFHFITDWYVEYTGFKLLFSFHRYPTVPEKTPSGLWNCSVDYWSDFQQHIGMCNSINECYAGEDEANCSHLHQECERGSISIGGRCYELVVHDGNITWNEAANECRRRDAYLANLKTADEWTRVLQFMSQLIGNKIYFGLHASSSNVPDLYRHGLHWNDESIVYYYKVDLTRKSMTRECSCLTGSIPLWYLTYTEELDFLEMILCDENVTDTFLCEKRSEPIETVPQPIRLQAVEWSGNGSHVVCPMNHMTFSFLACDVKSECWAIQGDRLGPSCNKSFAPQPPSFACHNSVERVPYSLVCDHRPDCSDNSDESFCSFPPCKRSESFQCSNKQCVLLEERCDKIEQCLDGSDEQQCPFRNIYNVEDFITPSPPAVIDFNSYGSYTVKSLEPTVSQRNLEDAVCPKTHFRCPGNWTVCMPVFVRCNGVNDCPNREDEMECDSYICPGFYRCRASSVCVHSSHMCDGVFQCPQRDDELLCGFVCPENCTCHGLAFFCSGLFPTHDFPELRFLDGQRSMIKLEDLKTNAMLVYLNLAECGLTNISHMEFPNLRTLDLRRNQLKTITDDDLVSMKKLQTLSLAENPLTSIFVTTPDVSFPLIQFLDMSDISLFTLNVTMFSLFPRLLSLNLSGCGIQLVTEEGFQFLTYLKYLDVRRCSMNEFPSEVFRDLLTLTEIWADNYKLCCSANLPDNFNLMNCHSPSDEISSCDALLRSDFYRVILSVFTVLALVGNLGSFVYRVCMNKARTNLGFDVFVTHLCVSDFLMGLYLAVIGFADHLYMGTYLWKDTVWKKSVICKGAGFLSLLSSEVSAFIICLITLDRFLVLRFPFSRLYFKKKSAHVACGIAWLVGVILAGIPLLPMTSHWEYYSQNGICIPLPITRNTFAGHDYSFIVMIVVNFVLFLLIAAGQVFIYWSIRTNSMAAGDSTKKSNDLAIARRLITIAMSDFLCWFPIGLLGVLASSGVPIPGEVNVAVAIIILPVNSAINPFLYTINMLLERRSRAREKRIQKLVMSAMASKYAETAMDRVDDAQYTKGEALNLIKSWVSGGLLSLNNLEVFVINEKEKMNQST